jgi:hypothetical protein
MLGRFLRDFDSWYPMVMTPLMPLALNDALVVSSLLMACILFLCSRMEARRSCQRDLYLIAHRQLPNSKKSKDCDFPLVHRFLLVVLSLLDVRLHVEKPRSFLSGAVRRIELRG